MPDSTSSSKKKELSYDDNLKNTVGNLTEMNNQLTKSLATLQGEKDELQSRLDSMQKDKRSLEKDLSNKSSKLDNIKTSFTEFVDGWKNSWIQGLIRLVLQNDTELEQNIKQEVQALQETLPEELNQIRTKLTDILDKILARNADIISSPLYTHFVTVLDEIDTLKKPYENLKSALNNNMSD